MGIAEKLTTVAENQQKVYDAGKKAVIEQVCPEIHETAAVVACSPLEGYPLTVTTEAGATKVTRCGKNLLQSTAESKTVSGITFTVHEDKTITANGTATGTIWFICGNVELVANGRYVMSGCPSGGNGATYNLYFGTIMDVGAGKELSYAEPKSGSVRFYVNKGITFNNALLKPMVRQAAADNIYEPYQTPETFAPGDTILGKPGVNTIYADVGEVTVTGRADPVAIIGNLTNAILSTGGNV